MWSCQPALQTSLVSNLIYFQYKFEFVLCGMSYQTSFILLQKFSTFVIFEEEAITTIKKLRLVREADDLEIFCHRSVVKPFAGYFITEVTIIIIKQEAT